MVNERAFGAGATTLARYGGVSQWNLAATRAGAPQRHLASSNEAAPCRFGMVVRLAESLRPPTTRAKCSLDPSRIRACLL